MIAKWYKNAIPDFSKTLFKIKNRAKDLGYTYNIFL